MLLFPDFINLHLVYSCEFSLLIDMDLALFSFCCLASELFHRACWDKDGCAD
jgi:hypothetical protein